MKFTCKKCGISFLSECETPNLRSGIKICISCYKSDPECAVCGEPATCLGNYSDDQENIEEKYACDNCCGHGNEGGYCERIMNEENKPRSLDQMVITLLAQFEGGLVKRCHTTPWLGEYTVGHHSYGVVAIILILHPDPSVNLLREANQHDAGERWSSDAPYPSKAAKPLLKQAIEEIETETRESVGLTQVKLNIEETRWLKAADMMDLWIHCQHQLAMGNRYAKRMIKVAQSKLDSDSTPAEMLRVYLRMKKIYQRNYVTRLTDNPNLLEDKV